MITGTINFRRASKINRKENNDLIKTTKDINQSFTKKKI